MEKKHFEVLDGLRGIAALSVVVFHFMEFIAPDYSNSFIGHGFLAVDFFFCLSGFVIAYAYDDRLPKIGMAAFFKLRLIRLHPLVVLGSVLGLLGFLFNPFAGVSQPESPLNITLIFVCSILMIPFPVMSARAFNLFGFNAPAWSLFWEYIANILYGLILYRISRRYLAVLTGVAALGICFVIYKSGSLLGGWSGPTFWDGLARVSYSFLAGMLIYRSGWIIKNRLGFLGMSVLLMLAFLSPFSKWNLLTESFIVLLFFPFSVIMGAGATPSTRLKNLCVLAGKLSYPLYMTHYWVLWIFGDFFEKFKPTGPYLFCVVLTAVLFQLILAYIAMVGFDIPVRRYFSNKGGKTNPH